MELYKKYRPKTLDRIVGQEETVACLRSMFKKGSIPHSILLSGQIGCGKTSIARIIKNYLECSDFDFEEINAAADNGVDSIRVIERRMRNNPMVGKAKVFLWDEAQKLTNESQTCALKMTEDTPDHVYFIMASSEPQKLIPGIISRFFPLPVRALTYAELTGLASRVAKKENIKLSEKVLDELAASADGSARTLLVLLEKLGNLSEKDQLTSIEARQAETNEAIDLCRALIQGKAWKTVADILKNLKAEPEKVRYAVLGYARQVLLKETGKTAHTAYVIIDCFKDNFYDGKAAALAHACYEVVNADKA